MAKIQLSNKKIIELLKRIRVEDKHRQEVAEDATAQVIRTMIQLGLISDAEAGSITTNELQERIKDLDADRLLGAFQKIRQGKKPGVEH